MHACGLTVNHMSSFYSLVSRNMIGFSIIIVFVNGQQTCDTDADCQYPICLQFQADPYFVGCATGAPAFPLLKTCQLVGMHLLCIPNYCLAGEYRTHVSFSSPAGTLYYCIKCAPGSFNQYAESSSNNNLRPDYSCTPCPAQYYQNQTGQTSCQPCPNGTYQYSTGQSSCLACPVQACPNGQYLASSVCREECNPCSACPTGQKVVKPCTNTSDTICGSVEQCVGSNTSQHITTYDWITSEHSCRKGSYLWGLGPPPDYTKICKPCPTWMVGLDGIHCQRCGALQRPYYLDQASCVCTETAVMNASGVCVCQDGRRAMKWRVPATWVVNGYHVSNLDLVYVSSAYISSINLSTTNDFQTVLPGLRGALFTVTFDTQILVVAGGNYTFCVNSDDGVRLFVDGSTVIANQQIREIRKQCTTVWISAGAHTVNVIFRQKYSQHQSSCVVTWSGPDTSYVETLISPYIISPDPCGPCEQNTYGLGGECYACGAGQVSAIGATSCETCAAGKYRLQSQAQCTSCEQGWYAPNVSGALGCVKCNTSCTLGTTRTACPNNPSANYSLCIPCADSLPGNASWIEGCAYNCLPGFYRTQGGCVRCSVNRICPAGFTPSPCGAQEDLNCDTPCQNTSKPDFYSTWLGNNGCQWGCETGYGLVITDYWMFKVYECAPGV